MHVCTQAHTDNSLDLWYSVVYHLRLGSGVKMQRQQIQDVVFFHENLIYSKVYRTIFRQISQKLGIPQGGSKKHFARNG